MQPTPQTQASADFDHHMMGIALVMARRGLGRTAPNPSVGAVVADSTSGTVLARATTASGGRPHAEPIALQNAGQFARGATLYVTLEPCSHYGHTPPCAATIVEAGIARVVCGILDPDPRVAGRGLEILRSAGIAVTRGIRAAEADAVTRGHICRLSQRRPFVQLKLALDADGAVPGGTGSRPTFVTGPDTRALGHLMRAQADAILVGHGTIAADDPELTCRLPGLGDRSPQRIILAREGLALAGRRIAKSAHEVPVTVVTGPHLAPLTRAAIEAAGARVETVPIVDGGVWLPAVLERLAERGVTRLLVEGGPQVWRAFARAGLVDEIVLMKAGAAAEPIATATARATGDIARHLGLTAIGVHDQRRLGPDRVWWLKPAIDHDATIDRATRPAFQGAA
jgi:diaminohydroxyphosphoribosylaminopyrimidine deaminase/5-amino-6-(5-phosphoribosylamino)uracil reductase